MKIIIAKKPIELSSVLIGVIFFLTAAFVCFIYSIDYSLLALIFLFFFYAVFFRKIENLPSYLDLAILAALALLVPLLVIITFKFSAYLVPAIGFVTLITILFEALELSLLFAFLISFVSAVIDGGNISVGMSLFAGSLAAAMMSFRLRRRFDVLRCVFLAGLVQFGVAFLAEHKEVFFVTTAFDMSLFRLCTFNMAVSLMFVLTFQPFFEYVFRVVTDISLLELSDFNHPLMRRLILETPGTYQHSLVVANLSEAAAESIGANPLLARVGAYYHDIGKMMKPDYFVENLVNYRDTHKKLKPSISKLIIFNHVKEGVELARKYRLNQKIIDFITEHHGRTLVYFFYQRAKELEPEGEHEEEYRYPGPKPQGKETAIVSLADTIEALSRTLEEPTPSRIEEMVREVVRKRFMEGELDESNLTLKDLEKITQSFIRMLNAIFHTRINYPKDEDRDSKSAKPKEGKP